jgi:SMC interacting uncharacterized protein involved in chromosome segregation
MSDELLKSIDTRLQSLELDYRVTKEVMDTRIKFIEDQVINHMDREDNDFKELKATLRGLDERLRSVDSLIEERISMCREDMITKNRDLYASKVEMEKLSGQISANTKVMGAGMAILTLVIGFLEVFIRMKGGMG